ncbi:MAG: SDR family NAD(P)-dependent oxidoreductase [Spartobacteria bacterium]|nr:SDR family NAD(P)-dependent oxidoreductase [Spartobacteria bacterium]
MPASPRRIVLTGATSGIGRALALEYAKPGRQLFLSGRDEERLATISALCRDKGAQVSATRLDVRDQVAMKSWIAASAATAPLDLAIGCAGVSASSRRVGGRDLPETLADTERLLEVNAMGAIRFAILAAESMLPHGRGQIALISSIAAYHGLPSSPAYCASKAAVRVHARALRHLLAPSGIKVNVICPGYVDTPMSRRLRGAQPLRWTSARAARGIVRALERDKPEYAFPWPLTLGLRILNFLPDALARFFLHGFAFDVDPDQESPLSRTRN